VGCYIRTRVSGRSYRARGDIVIPARRIIPCLDVRDGKVVKGVQFRNHRIVGDILQLADTYCRSGADELVFYDITASPDGRSVDRRWVREVAALLNIPFCVAGGIRGIADAEDVLEKGADKISINSPALENPQLITELAKRFGSQCVVLGIDSGKVNGGWQVHQYSGDEKRTTITARSTGEWIAEAQDLGAGEIVLNCMNSDGVRGGYDIAQISTFREKCDVPLVASGGAGSIQDFEDVLTRTNASAALAASVFHSGEIDIMDLKRHLRDAGVEVRI
jgi:cyclase